MPKSFRIKTNLLPLLVVVAIIFTAYFFWKFSSSTGGVTPALQRHKLICKKLPKINIGEYLRIESRPNELQPFLDSILPSMRIDCTNSPSIGNVFHPERTDGTYSICNSGAFRLLAPCLIYSFGIGDDFAFEDATSSIFGCLVRAFDPTTSFETHERSRRIHFERVGVWDADETNVSVPIVVGVNDFFAANRAGWTLHRFDTLRHLFNDSEKVVDVLKFDIETSDIVALVDMLNSGSLNNVKQFVGEIHPRCGGLRVWQPVFECLFAAGFRVLHFEKFDDGRRYEFAMLNTRLATAQATIKRTLSHGSKRSSSHQLDSLYYLYS